MKELPKVLQHRFSGGCYSDDKWLACGRPVKGMWPFGRPLYSFGLRNRFIGIGFKDISNFPKMRSCIFIGAALSSRRSACLSNLNGKAAA